MDTSETYIKMCEKATEIQDYRPLNKEFDDGDFIFTESFKDFQIYSIDNWGDTEWGTISKRKDFGPCVWLPRQDQLQEMLLANYPTSYKLAKHFGDYWWDIIGAFKMSMEQLWLAFVMKEKYNKTWNGDNWITSSE